MAPRPAHEYRGARRMLAKMKFRWQNKPRGSFADFWQLFRNKEARVSRSVEAERKAVRTKTYTSNGAREVARRLRRMK